MTTRLSPLDTAFWSLEAPDAPLHIGALAAFLPAPGVTVDPDALIGVLAARAQTIPRLRRRVRSSWNPLEGPYWEDQPDFDATAHLTHHAVDQSATGLEDTVAALMAKPVPRHAPPWEIHLLSTGTGFFLLFKVHHAAVDGLRALEVGMRLFDQFADAPPRSTTSTTSRPATVPPTGPLPLRLLRAIPVEARRTLRAAELAGDALLASVGGVERALLRPSELRRPAPGPPALALPTLDLDEIRTVRKAHGGTVNDVVLALLAGTLRAWGESDDARVLVPVSDRGGRRSGATAGGNRLSGYLVDLPVSEPDPRERLRLVREAMDAHKRRGPRRGAGAVALLADLLPASGHQLTAPLLRSSAPLLFDALVTNVPMPDFSFSLGGHALTGLHPLPPLAQRQTLAVAVSSYLGRVHLGLRGRFASPARTADLRDALDASMAELLATC
ncbi:diacylglycerol O-acyltransferase [Streptacidiphilus sp. MAP12-20]|uniref:wax ester/triacylglycerol synthase domain-containing protein n=1 Tax=Streptacidiphilus sp. MAP12-20 TaxID=3156299 RepID=UPI0035193F44